MKYQKLRVCAWRVKYFISLPQPLGASTWQAIAREWTGSRVEVLPLPSGVVLHKLHLPDQIGYLTGSSISADIYAVLLRENGEEYLERVLAILRQCISSLDA